jgi:uncharacterized protein (TIGR02001 family)
VTAATADGNWPRTPTPDGFRAPRSAAGLLFALLLTCPAPAIAAVGASVSVLNEDVFRGRSLSDGRPVAVGELSYDDLSGFYVGGSITGIATRHSGAQLLGVQGYAGYAHQIGSGPTLDVGITNARYTHYYSGSAGVDYTEFYAGIITDHISSHIRYSPNYFGTGQATVYGDLDGVLRPWDKWRLNAHAGLLIQASGPTLPHSARRRYDWRIGVSREIGRFSLQLGWAGSGPGRDYYAGSPHGRSSFLLGATYIF